MTPASAEKMLATTGIDPMRRAETLSLEDWLKLCKAVLIADSA
jgi:16S rRNA A1518/A1519 N6-dimethyltransferase RsmA/KsgA/DIM1 with predicted DNA glycosylase/AP lyase activity